MLIHPPSIFTIACLLTLLLGCMQLWLWRQDREQRALATIGIAYLVGAIGSVLLSSRGHIADRISIDVANALIGLGYGLVWSGMRQFERRPPRPVVCLLGAAAWLAACQVPAFYADFPARVLLMSLIIATYCVAAARELWIGQVSRSLPSRRPLVALLLLNALLHVMRAPLLLLSPAEPEATKLPTASAWFAFVSLAAVVVIVGISLFLVALAKEQAQQRSIAAMAAARDASEKASAEKSRFLARMSHELRTLLNSVFGMAQLLARDPGLDPARREHAATLERAGRHLVAIVNDVLDLARVEAGRLELAPRPVDLRGLLEETVELARPAALAKDIVLSLRLFPPVPAAVLADPVRVRQILLNLLGNAVKFTPEGGEVSLSARSGPAGLALAVTDNGPGVPPELRERLFQDYERMGADAAGMEGTGLGLAITAALAHAMGGKVSYAPGPGGVGSCFSVELPLAAATLPVPMQAAAPQPAPAADSLRILVVDDIAANRMVAEALLTQAGHRVDTFADGASAVAAIERGPLPDVVLMDVYMPGMDGFATTARIRALPGAARRVPILAVTAEAAPDEVRACLDSGMDGHVAKPIDRDGLLGAIAEATRVRA
ncbi:hybrid sensor histidine kinase/response regulator [Neoroseomonas soli]|uniref:histidine kinase n=1 Tax=Neoroseomonas soli TaxID=1081025 RepID=A0A9X9X3Q8_9PROT|nr:ATP-binding protein [Neoroseomonas soli]MBR0674037.1 response regulator [Neoroseomonas soli]